MPFAKVMLRGQVPAGTPGHPPQLHHQHNLGGPSSSKQSYFYRGYLSPVATRGLDLSNRAVWTPWSSEVTFTVRRLSKLCLSPRVRNTSLCLQGASWDTLPTVACPDTTPPCCEDPSTRDAWGGCSEAPMGPESPSVITLPFGWLTQLVKLGKPLLPLRTC